MAYNQQNDGYNRVNQPLPGTGATHLEDSYETVRPSGLVGDHLHNQPPQVGAGAGKVGIIDKIKNVVMPGHQAQQHTGTGAAYNTTGANTYNTTGTTGTNVGTAGLDHATLNAMFPDGVTDNADVRHKHELVGGSTYASGHQQPGLVDKVKNAVTGHGTATHGQGHPVTSDGYSAAPVATGLAAGYGGHNAYDNTTGTDHVHGQKKGIVEKVKDAVTPGHGTATHGATTTHGHGHPMTSDGYSAAPVATGLAAGYGGHNAYDNTTGTDHVHGQKKGIVEKVKDAVAPGHHHNDTGHHAIGTVPTSANAGELVHNNMAYPPAMPHNNTHATTNYETTVSNANTEVLGGAPHQTGTTYNQVAPLAHTGATHNVPLGTQPVEHKQGGIKGLIGKVTGH